MCKSAQSTATARMLNPPIHKELTILNTELFKISVTLTALVLAQQSCKTAMSSLKGFLFNEPRTRCILNYSNNKRLLLLNQNIQASNINDLPEAAKKFAIDENAEIQKYELILDYKYWTGDQILRSILPDELEVPNSFETVGHIAHMNLRDAYLPYKHIIGQVILDKTKNLKCVVNKVGTIHNTFRFFQMEVLAGDSNMITRVKESGCQFALDFSKLYWNSRLQTEHDRLIKQFKKGQFVCDVFAGIGPFAVPAARNQHCLVFANDLNPVSVEYLEQNIRLNKVHGKVRPYNMDGREFIAKSLTDLNDENIMKTMTAERMFITSSNRKKEDSETDPILISSGFRVFDHYVMNLPATAIEFLDAFKGLFKNYKNAQSSIIDKRLPTIHCYCFSKSDDIKKDVIERVERVLGVELGDNLVEVFNIRDVAPKKQMVCISFKLPESIAFETQSLKRKNDNIN